jgi:hypothetical protein
MPVFRVLFSDPRAVNIEAETEGEAIEIVMAREWEYGMDWDDGEIDITSVTEL